MTTTRVARQRPGVNREGVGLWCRSPWLGGLLALGPCLLGCQQLFGQDPARCDQSATTVRQAIAFKDFDSARKWRDSTWKVCDERAIVATLDKEILDGEAAVAAEADAAKKKAEKLAQDRINAAQKVWLTFDSEPAADKTEPALAAARKSAKRLERGLEPTYAQKLAAYNDAEYQKRLAALIR